ncbi:MAG TPA: taurine dioxygenase [Aquabacterium sp.]|nr:taurine dioxygenase [Aquabacterium sp.]HQC94337.1 taurine dioxygenase [Aquabacterium sp.]
MRTPALHVQPLGPAIGALVSGLQLSDGVTDAQRDTLLAALLKHHVLFFEGQSLAPLQQRALAARFGDLHIHPVYPQAPGVPEIIVLDTSDNNPPDNDNWHTDVTFLAAPAMGAILSAQLLPPSGGDTLWASGIAAYAALSAPYRRMLAGLTAEHDFLKSFPAHRFARTPEEKLRWDKARSDHPPRLHPVVRTHPVSGAQGLFVSEGFTTRIVELGATESDAVLRQLFAHLAKPEFTVRWRWKLGDVAFWDNRLTQHYATADYLPARRVMHRATILGDVPFYRPDAA